MTTPPTLIKHGAFSRSGLRASWQAWWCAWSSTDGSNNGQGWMQYFWTFVFNTAIAFVLSIVATLFTRADIGFGQIFASNMLFSQCIGFTIHLIFRLSTRLLGSARLQSLSESWRLIYYCGTPLAGFFIGYSIAFAIKGRSIFDVAQEAPGFVVSSIALSLVFSAVLYQFFKQKALVAEAVAGRERERARVNELERLAIDAQLRTLQAQIEPHFLFNTLANVASLIGTQPAQAQRMLERLIQLLRASLTAARQPSATLAQESRLLSAYLEILQLRMGDRLAYTIEIPEPLGGASIPPLSLQPLVENAIRHGLEPKVEGGRVQVKASAADDRLEICVEDDGLGFAPRTDAGFGLSNLRDRLAAMYGGRARMSIEDRAPGTRVRISLPLILAPVT